MKDFFGHATIDNFDAVSYINRIADNVTSLPNIGIAVSGGGYRAMLTGAGAIKAFDSRTENSTGAGQLGGLLQSATYIAGLSGGSWLMASIFINNFTSISTLQDDGTGEAWQLDNSILKGPDEGGFQLLDSADYYKTIAEQVNAKSDAGYDITITDIWYLSLSFFAKKKLTMPRARMLSFQFINATNGGPNYTWSSIALDPNFAQGNAPMPLVVADLRSPGETILGSNSTVLEFSPFEFGSWDPTVYAFAPLQYLGSRFSGGVVPAGEPCVRGFDNAGFVFGTSSTLFNQFITYFNTSSLPSVLSTLIEDLAHKVGQDNEDIADYVNPFYNYTHNDALFSKSRQLSVVDGGEDLQNVPLYPLIQPERKVDVIFAVDSSADTTYSWPNGTSLMYTYQRSLNSTGIGNGTAFPSVPDQNTFINLGLNTRPTFFGCNSSNSTGPMPIVVYLPNYPYVTGSNTSTFDLEYNSTQRDAMILNSYDMVTMANGTRDKNWPACVSCAILSRSFERTNTNVPDICNSCFNTYCWDGTVNSTAPGVYEPTFDLSALSLSGAAGKLMSPGAGFLAVFVGLATTIFML